MVDVTLSLDGGNRLARGKGVLRPLLILSLTLLAAFFNLRDPIMPGSGLDASWVLATEHAARSGAVFGRDFVFTYGPYFRLATRLFDPDRFAPVLFYDVATVVLLCAPALLAGSIRGIAAVAAALFLLAPATDSLVMAGFLAVFLSALKVRDARTIALVAICGPLVLSKLSFILVLGPLVLLADAFHARHRRLPLFTGVLAASILLSLVAAGQPLSSLPDLARNSLAIIFGYGHAMELRGAFSQALLAVGLSGVLILVCAWRLIGRPVLEAPDALRLRVIANPQSLAALSGVTWFLFIAFKAGFVRQDTHPMLTFEAIVLGTAVLAGHLSKQFYEDPAPRIATPLLGLAIISIVVVCYVARSGAQSPGTLALPAAEAAFARTVGDAPDRLTIARNWLLGSRWKDATTRREQALADLKRAFPPTVVGSVDVIPYDLAEVIGSGLDYRPRPIPQSYSAYTPHLQNLDAAHFAGTGAPDTLLIKLLDIDGRLPTLALGPSLPVIAARYDAVGMDRLGLVMRRRELPRPVATRPLGQASIVLNRWMDLPRSNGVVMGRFDIRPTLATQIIGFLFKDPALAVHLRSASGKVRSYRFIPGMAREGVALSPLPTPGSLGAFMLLEPSSGLPLDPVVAMMIEGHEWAYRGGAVSFQAVQVQPAANQALAGRLRLRATLALSDPTGLASLDAAEIFAHAPTTLRAPIAEPTRLDGVVGLRAHPPGPPSDGARFLIKQIEPTGRQTVLFDRVLSDGAAEAPFSIALKPGAELVLTTDALGNPNFDWSYWRLFSRPAA